MLSGPSIRLAFSLILSGFPLTFSHLAEALLSAFSIYFFVALYSCVCSCPQISRNIFYLWLFTSLVFIWQLTCFICTTWKLKQTMERQPLNASMHASEWNQNKNKIKSHRIRHVILLDLAHKQCDGIMKGWFHCLTSDWKRRYLVNGCVPLTITYHLYFLRISKVSSMLHHRSLGRVHSKEYYFIFTYTLFSVFCCFSSKSLCFYHFHFHYFILMKYWVSATEYLPIRNRNRLYKIVNGTVYSDILPFGSAWYFGHGANPIFFNKKQSEDWTSRTLANPPPLSPIEKDTLAQEFSCEFCKISKKTFFTEEHLWWLLLKGISLGFSEISKCKLSSSLAHFGPASHFYTPWKLRKIYGFLSSE